MNNLLLYEYMLWGLQRIVCKKQWQTLKGLSSDLKKKNLLLYEYILWGLRRIVCEKITIIKVTDHQIFFKKKKKTKKLTCVWMQSIGLPTYCLKNNKNKHQPRLITDFFDISLWVCFFFILKCALQPLDRLLDSTSNLVYKVVCLK